MIRRYRSGDADEWLRLRFALWPVELAAHAAEMDQWLERADAAVFVATRPGGDLCGFVEVGARPYADGCESSPVAFIEGWYVDPDSRRTGIGRALIHAAEEWAKQQRYRELASDVLLDNTASQRAHERIGFVEVERAVKYRKQL